MKVISEEDRNNKTGYYYRLGPSTVVVHVDDVIDLVEENEKE